MITIMIKISSIGNEKGAKQLMRLSNIELLRIIAMLLIMFGHSYLRLRHLPDSEIVKLSPFSSYWNVLLSCITTTGVGIFIAISGWFGIKFKGIGIAKYIYLVLFLLWGLYVSAIAFHVTEFNLSGIKISLGFYEGYWFVISYLGLYIMSPLLNIFIEKASKKDIELFLLFFFFFQSYFSWMSGWYDYYGGYSILLFSGIYIASGYLRKYPIQWLFRNAFLLWIITVLMMALIAMLSLTGFGHAARQIRDDNPLAILASIFAVLSFLHLKFHCSFVNWLAASCFAVYLIHYSPFVYPYFMKLVGYIFSGYCGLAFCLLFLLFLMGVYLACTLVDQIRIISWNLLTSFFLAQKKC